MTQEKTVFWGIRVSEPLKERVMAEAERRGMNLSEFVRYALNVFFDHYDDSTPQKLDTAPRLLVDTPMLYGLGPEEVLEEQHGPRSAEEER